MPRFVLLYHDCPTGRPRPSHWDLMLEQGEVLRTWSLAALPQEWAPLAALSDAADQTAASNTVAAESLGDHRPAYLDFEGPLSNDRGQVTRVEAGTYVAVQQALDRWEVEVAGGFLKGRITLSRSAADSTHWRLSYQSIGGDS